MKSQIKECVSPLKLLISETDIQYLPHIHYTNIHLTLSSMIQSKVMNKRSKVTKRQKVLLTSEIHFFSPASQDPALTELDTVLTDPLPLPVSHDSETLLPRLSIAGHALWAGPAPPSGQPSEGGLEVRGRGGSWKQDTGPVQWMWTQSVVAYCITASAGRIKQRPTNQPPLRKNIYFLFNSIRKTGVLGIFSHC